MLRRLSVALLCAAIATVVLAPAGWAAPPQPLGILDLDGYCRSLGYDQSTLTSTQVGPNAAHGNWRCDTGSGKLRPISMEQACKWQYNRRAVQAHPTNPDDAYTWVCYAVGGN